VIRNWFENSMERLVQPASCCNEDRLEFRMHASQEPVYIRVGERFNAASMPNAPENTPAELRKQDKN
jgi:hypothetical protein